MQRRAAVPFCCGHTSTTTPAAALLFIRHSSSRAPRRQRSTRARPHHTTMAAAASSSSGVPNDLVGFVAATAPAGSQHSLGLLFASVGVAVKQIAARVARAGLEGLLGVTEAQGTNASGDAQKKLDVVAHDIMMAVLASNPDVCILASEEADAAVACSSSSSGGSSTSSSSSGGGYALVFDPLDGSRNIDVNIPTGTIFGVYRVPPGATPEAAVLQPGSELVAAGYALYSSATMLVMSTGQGTHGFTLDPSTGEFMLSHPDIRIPPRGQMYSLNDARYSDWPAGLQRYVDTIRQGQGQTGKQYSARYVCSLVADFHRTLLQGGWCANPRSHLRLVYEGNPLAMLCEQAGGAAVDGRERIRAIAPSALHQRLHQRPSPATCCCCSRFLVLSTRCGRATRVPPSPCTGR